MMQQQQQQELDAADAGLPVAVQCNAFDEDARFVYDDDFAAFVRDAAPTLLEVPRAFKPTDYVRFTNGVYDLCEHRLLSSPDPDDAEFCSLKSTGYDYVPPEDVPQAQVDEYRAYLASLFPDPDMREYMECFVASTFAPNHQQLLHLFHGWGSNGVSTFTDEFLARLHGDRSDRLSPVFWACANERQHWYSSILEHEWRRTAGASVLVTNELYSADDVFIVDRWRQLRRSNDHFGAWPVVVCGGGLPKVSDTHDRVFFDRLRVIPFDAGFTHYYRRTELPSGGDDRAPARSANELRAALDRLRPAVAALSLARLRAGRAVPPPNACRAIERVAAQFRKSFDVVSAFIADVTVPASPKAIVAEKQLLQSFKLYLKEFGEHDESKHRNELLRRMSRNHKRGAAPRTWQGVQLLGGEDVGRDDA